MERTNLHARASALTMAAIAILAAMSAHGETSGASATGFTVTHRFDTAAAPARVFRAVHDVGRWWSDAHTWSGHGGNLRLQPGAGGCFCERWGKNSVKHGEVIFSAENRMVRLRAALGPLQERAADGILTFALTPAAGRTNVLVTYRVAGSPDAGLGELAGPVDQVIGEQVVRLARYVDTGRPTAGTR